MIVGFHKSLSLILLNGLKMSRKTFGKSGGSGFLCLTPNEKFSFSIPHSRALS